MLRRILACVLLFSGAVVALAITGCGSATSEGHKAPAAATQKDNTGSDEQSANEANLAKLSPKDRTLAAAQKVCPVSGELLGSMGVPYKVTVKEKVIFLCCGGCEDEFLANPDKFLAKMSSAPAK